MNSFKISWMLFKNNFKLYKFYVVVLMVTTAIYYNFLSVSFNPYMDAINDRYMFAKTASTLCSIILFFTVLFFMIHANNFFYKQRYKEIGTYMLMGIKTSKIGRVFAVESMILGSISALTGTLVGILFSKLFFMLLGKAMILNTKIPFYVSSRAISTLVFVFAGIIVCLGIKNYMMVKKSKLIEILNTLKKEQSIPKMKWIRGILGVIFIVSGYILALNIMDLETDLLTASILILILVCVGTYFFFGSFLSIILQGCINNKSLIYKGSRLTSFSNTLFRLGTHYRSFAMTAVLCACTVSAFSGSLGLKYYADSNALVEAPFSISYINQDEDTNKEIKEKIMSSTHKIIAEHETHFIKGKITFHDGNHDRKEDCLITSYSEVQKSLEVIKPKNYQEILKQIKPKDNEVVSILHSSLMFSGISNKGKTYIIKGKAYTLKKEIKIPFIGEMNNIGQYQTYIVTDEEYNKLIENNEEMILRGINITNAENSKELVIEIANIMKNHRDNINSYAGQYEYKYYLIGSFYFLGLVMAMVFMIATFSTIYFKILSDALLDKSQYKMLIKIGMTKDEIKRSIYTQVGIAFVLPAILGIAHSIMAMEALEALMYYSFTSSTFMGVGIFVIVMVIFYIFISRKYIDMIYEGWDEV